MYILLFSLIAFVRTSFFISAATRFRRARTYGEGDTASCWLVIIIIIIINIFYRFASAANNLGPLYFILYRRSPPPAHRPSPARIIW